MDNKWAHINVTKLVVKLYLATSEFLSIFLYSKMSHSGGVVPLASDQSEADNSNLSNDIDDDPFLKEYAFDDLDIFDEDADANALSIDTTEDDASDVGSDVEDGDSDTEDDEKFLFGHM